MTKARRKPPPRKYPSMRARIIANVRFVEPPKWTGLRDDPDPRRRECWIWQGGSYNSRGYALLLVREARYCDRAQAIVKKQVAKLVHRFVLLVFRGIDLNEVECACHQCSTKPCVNPWHVDPGSAEENRVDYYERERWRRPVERRAA